MSSRMEGMETEGTPRLVWLFGGLHTFWESMYAFAVASTTLGDLVAIVTGTREKSRQLMYSYVWGLYKIST